MKRILLSIVCALAAPFAFAQTTTTTEQTTTTAPTTTTETTTTTASGTVNTFTPGEMIVVKREGVGPVRFVLGKTVHFVNRAGKTVENALIKPGTKVQVIYTKSGDQMVADRVVVDED